MKVAQVKFVSWDKAYNFSLNELELEVGDSVVVKTDLGLELGEVSAFVDLDEKEYFFESEAESSSGADNAKIAGDKIIKPILRKASLHDLNKTVSVQDRKEALDFGKKMKDKHNLPMKFIDVHYSFDGSRMTFAFIADGRVDFRELVKDLTRHFNKSIRLQQIGIRDEARIMGDVGHCGQKLCCRGHLRNLDSITSDMAEIQECAHRGSDRISGICGRLMCCLAYEHCGYEEMSKKLPAIGTKVNVDGKRGVIVGRHVLKQSVNVEFRDKEAGGNGRIVVEVDINRNKKKS